MCLQIMPLCTMRRALSSVGAVGEFTMPSANPNSARTLCSPCKTSKIQGSMASAPGHGATEQGPGLTKRTGLLSSCFRCFQQHEEPLAHESRCKQPSKQPQSGSERSLALPPKEKGSGRVHTHAIPRNEGSVEERQLPSRPAEGSQVC